MYSPSEQIPGAAGQASILNFQKFQLKDQSLFQQYIDRFSPQSCEYNFANLFSWQAPYQLMWSMWRERILIYDGVSKVSFMPLGPELLPEELVILSLNLKQSGMGMDFGLAEESYIRKYPDIREYYTVNTDRGSAEYIYDVNSLCELSGTKLHKKKNLISQFRRYYPEVRTVAIRGEENVQQAQAFALNLLERRKRRSKTLDQEFSAIQTSLKHFDQLGLEGLMLMLKDQVIAFSVFSRLSPSTYDIQFEKSDPDFKGAAQAINHETASHLKDKCRFLNREQDLGIKGLRQAKLSYDPVELINPCDLIFKQF